MDAKFINPFVLSIQRVFETMVNTKVQIGKPYLKHGTEATSDVSGVIGFSGEATGCIVLSFPKDVACKAASSFAGIKITMDHADFADAIGELANMVAGNAKTEFEGTDISISLPSVIIGSNHQVLQSKNCPRIVIPCTSDLGPMYVEIGMTMNKAARTTPAVAGVTA